MINKTVKFIHDNFWDRKLPVDIEKIAQSIGMSVVYDDMPDHSGMFEYVNGVPVCIVNKMDTPARQRFTIAHEMGHYALRHEGKLPRDKLNIMKNADPREIAANKFAAEILMPENLLSVYVQKGLGVKELAKLFNVSSSAIIVRLKILGWLKSA